MTTTLTITLPDLEELAEEQAPVYERYPGQTEAQPAHISLDEDGEVSVSSDPEIGGAVPMNVWHGRVRRYRIPCDVKGKALADFLGREDIQQALEVVHGGRTEFWDGSNYVGRLTTAARDAEEFLTAECESWFDESDRVSPMTCEDFLIEGISTQRAGEPCGWNDEPTEFVIADTGGDRVVRWDTPDEKLAKWAAQYEGDAAQNDTYLETPMLEYLEGLRDTARENTPEFTLMVQFGTPPECQGQHVICSYGYSDDDEIIEKSVDRSTSPATVTYLAYEDGDLDGWEFEPNLRMPVLGDLIGPVRPA